MPKYGYLTVVILAALLSTTWLSSALLIRGGNIIYFPLAVRFLLGSLTLLAIPAIFLRRVPQHSLRLLHAALSVSGLTYFLGPILLQMSLATLPSGFVALVYCTVPIWLTLLVKGFSTERFPDYFLVLLGLCCALAGCWGIAGERGEPLLALLYLALSCGCQVLGIYLSRRLFWLHSALDLNFWAMALAGVTHLLLSAVQGEFFFLKFFPQHPDLLVLYLWLGAGATGAAAYLYRVESMTRNTLVLLTVLVPCFSMVLGFAGLEETPLNVFTLGGLGMVLFVLAKESWKGIPVYWMTLMLNNDRRQGDRLTCLLDG